MLGTLPGPEEAETMHTISPHCLTNAASPLLSYTQSNTHRQMQITHTHELDYRCTHTHTYMHMCIHSQTNSSTGSQTCLYYLLYVCPITMLGHFLIWISRLLGTVNSISCQTASFFMQLDTSNALMTNSKFILWWTRWWRWDFLFFPYAVFAHIEMILSWFLI